MNLEIENFINWEEISNYISKKEDREKTILDCKSIKCKLKTLQKELEEAQEINNKKDSEIIKLIKSKINLFKK